MKFLVQTDGAADWHDGIGGWAYNIWVILDEDDDFIMATNKDCVEDTTNIRMELTAIKNGLRMFKFLFGKDNKEHVLLETDSQWMVNCLSGASFCTKNTDLLDDIRDLVDELKAEIKWVPREQLKLVDGMAKEAMRYGKKKYAR